MKTVSHPLLHHARSGIAASITFILFLLIFLPSCNRAATEKKAPAGMYYTCSMHPQIHQDHMGDCPICGMNLTLVKEKSGTQSTSGTTPTPRKTEPAIDKETNATTGEKTGGVSSASTAAPLVTPVREDGTNTAVMPSEIIKLGPASESVTSAQIEGVEKRELIRAVRLFGEVAYIADRHLDYTWYFAGRIQQVLIDYNTTEVKAGQAIYRIRSEELIEAQQQYLAKLRELWLSTFTERRLIEGELATLRSQLAQAGITTSDLERLEKEKKVLSEFEIRAPRSGTIVAPLLHTGERFTRDMVLMHVSDLSSVWFVAQVFEQDLGLLKLGQNAKISTQAQPGKVYAGKLVFIGRTLDPAKRVAEARFEISNAKRELLPSLSGVSDLEIKLENSLPCVPSSAVIDTGTRRVVYVMKGTGEYEQRTVTTGADGHIEGKDGRMYTQIREGLNAGERVVTTGSFLLDAEAQLHSGSSPTTEPMSSAPSSVIPAGSEIHPSHQH